MTARSKSEVAEKQEILVKMLSNKRTSINQAHRLLIKLVKRNIHTK